MSTFSEMAAEWLRQQVKVEKQPETVLREDERLSQIPPHDPAEWRKSFARWLISVCVRHPRCFGGVVRIHDVFCEWEILQGEVPCTLDTFKQLLEESELPIGEVDGVVLVSGLTFREDVEALEHPNGPYRELSPARKQLVFGMMRGPSTNPHSIRPLERVEHMRRIR